MNAEALLARAKERIAKKDISNKQNELITTETQIASSILEKARSRAVARRLNNGPGPEMTVTEQMISHPASPMIELEALEIDIEEIKVSPEELFLSGSVKFEIENVEVPSTSIDLIRQNARVSAKQMLASAREKTAQKMKVAQEEKTSNVLSESIQTQSSEKLTSKVDPLSFQTARLASKMERHTPLAQLISPPPPHDPKSLDLDTTNDSLTFYCKEVFSQNLDLIGFIEILCPIPSFLVTPFPDNPAARTTVQSTSHTKHRHEAQEIASMISELSQWKTQTLKYTHAVYLRIANACQENLVVQRALGTGGIMSLLCEHLTFVSSLNVPSISPDDKKMFYLVLESGLNAASLLLKCGSDVTTCSLENIQDAARYGLTDLVGKFLHQHQMLLSIAEPCLSIVSTLSLVENNCQKLLNVRICESLMEILGKCGTALSEKIYLSMIHLLKNHNCLTILMGLHLLPIAIDSLATAGEHLSSVICCLIGVIGGNREYSGLIFTNRAHYHVLNALKRYPRSLGVIENGLFALVRLFILEPTHRVELSDTSLLNLLLVTLKTHRTKKIIISFSLAICAFISPSGLPNDIAHTIFLEIFGHGTDYLQHGLCTISLYHLLSQEIFQEFASDINICQFLSQFSLQLSHLSDSADYSSSQASTLRIVVYSAIGMMCRCNPENWSNFNKTGICQHLVTDLQLCESISVVHLPALLLCVVNLCEQPILQQISLVNINDFSCLGLPRILLTFLSDIDEKAIQNQDSFGYLIAYICYALGSCALATNETNYFDKKSFISIVTLLKTYPSDALVIQAVCHTLLNLSSNTVTYINWFLEFGFESALVEALSKTYHKSKTAETVLHFLIKVLTESSSLSKYLHLNLIPILDTLLNHHRNLVNITLPGFLILRLFLTQCSIQDLSLQTTTLGSLSVKILSQFSTNQKLVQVLCDVLPPVISLLLDLQLMELCSLLPSILLEWFENLTICDSILHLLSALLRGEKSLSNTFGDHGLCAILLRLLKFQGHRSLNNASLICDILATLCHENQDNAIKCADVDGCSIVLQTLDSAYHQQTANVMISSSKLIANLINYNVNNQITCGRLGLESIVLYFFSSWSSEDEMKIKLHLLFALKGLGKCEIQNSQINTKNVSNLRDSNVIKAIANCLRKYQTCKEIVICGSQLLTLLGSSDLGRKKIHDEGLCIILSMILATGEDQIVLEYVSETVALVTEYSRSAAQFEREKIFEKMAEYLCLFQSSPQLLQRSCTTMANILKIFVPPEMREKLRMKQHELINLNICVILSQIVIRFAQDARLYQSIAELVYYIIYSNPEIVIVMSNSNLLELICRGLEQHYCDAKAVASGCLAVSGLVCDVKTIKVIVGQLGICERILSLLAIYSNDPEVVTNACRAIDKLASDCQENSMRFGTKGACEIITGILEEHLTRNDVVKAASSAIASLSSNSKENSVRMGNQDVCTKVVRTLKISFSQRDDAIFSSSLSAFIGLSRGNIINQLEFGSLGICELFVDILSHWHKGPLFTASVFQAIINLCSHKVEKSTFLQTNVERFIDVGGHQIVFALTKDQKMYHEVVSSGCLILFYFISCSPDVLQSLHLNDLSELLSSSLLQHIRVPLATENICLLTELLLCTSTGVLDLLKSQNFVTTIVDAFRIQSSANKIPDSLEASLRICNCISTFLEYGQMDVGLLLDKTEFSILLASIISERKENIEFCRVLSLTVSRMLTFCDQDSLLIQFKLRGMCESLVSLLLFHSQGQVITTYNICEAIYSLTKNSAENRTRCGQAGACDALCQSLSYFADDPRFCVIGAQTISALAIDNPVNQTTFGMLGICGLIIDLMKRHPTNIDVIQSTGFALEKIISKNAVNISRLQVSGAFEVIQKLYVALGNHPSTPSDLMSCFSFILESLLSCGDNTRNFFNQYAIDEIFISLIYRYSSVHSTVISVFSLIRKLCFQCPESVKRFLNIGICEAIDSTLKSASNSQELLVCVCECVSALSCYEDCIHHLLDIDVCSFLFNIYLRIDIPTELQEELAVAWCDFLSDVGQYDRVRSSVSESLLPKYLILIFNKFSGKLPVLKAFCLATLVLAESESARNEFELSNLAVILFHAGIDSLDINNLPLDILEPLLRLLSVVCASFPDQLGSFAGSFESKLSTLMELHRRHRDIAVNSLQLLVLLTQRNLELNIPLEHRFSEHVAYILKQHPRDSEIFTWGLQCVYNLCRISKANIDIFLDHDLFSILEFYLSENLIQCASTTSLISYFDVLYLWNESNPIAARFLSTSDIPCQILNILKYYSQDIRTVSSSTIITTGCRVIGTLLDCSLTSENLMKNGLVEIMIECFSLFLQYPDVQIAISCVLDKLLLTQPTLLSTMVQLGIYHTLVSAIQSMFSHANGLSHIFSLLERFILIDREATLNSILECPITFDLFTIPLQRHEKNRSVNETISRCIAELCAGGFLFPESNEIYPLLVENLRYFLGDGVDISVSRAISSLSRFSRCISEKFGILGACPLLIDGFCLYCKQELEESISSFSISIHVLCSQCPTNRDRILVNDGTSKLVNLLCIDHNLKFISLLCKTIAIITQNHESNILSFISQGTCELLLRNLQKYKLNREIVVAICTALRSLKHEVLQARDIKTSELAELSTELRFIYSADGEALACSLSLLSLTSIAELDVHNSNFDAIQNIVETLVHTLRIHLKDTEAVFQASQGIYAVVKEFPMVINSLLEKNICSTLSEAISYHISQPKTIEMIYLAISILLSKSMEVLRVFSKTKIVDLTLVCFYQHSNEVNTLIALCLTVKYLISHVELKLLFRNSDLPEQLLNTMKKHTILRAELTSLSSQCLRELTITESKTSFRPVLLRLINLGGCQTVVSIFKHYLHLRDICLSSIGMLHNFLNEIEGRLELVQSGVCKLVLDGLVMHQDDESVSLQGLYFLSDLISYGNMLDVTLVYTKESKDLMLDILVRHIKNPEIVLLVSGEALEIMKSPNSEARALDILIRVFENYYNQENHLILINCFKLFMNMISLSSLQIVAAHNVHQLAVESILNLGDNPAVAEQFFRFVVQSIDIDQNQSIIWIEHGFCETFVSLANTHFRSAHVGHAACWAVTSVSLHSSDAIVRFSNSDAPKVIASVFQWNLNHDMKTSEAALRAILVLSASNPRNSAVFGLCGVCEMVSKFLVLVQNEMRLSELAIEAIWHLSCDTNSNQVKFLSSDAPSLIVKAADIWSSDPGIARVICGAIWYSSLNYFDGQRAFNALSASDKLEKILKLHPKRDDISKLCCGALWSLSSNSGSSEISLSSCRTLLDTIHNNKDNPEVISTIFSTIGSMCRNSTISSLFGIAGTCELIIDSLKHHGDHPVLLIATCHAITGLCSDEKNQEKLFASGLTQILCLIIQNQIINKEILVAAYQSLSKFIESRSHIALELIECHFQDLVLRTLGTHPLDKDIQREVFKTVSQLIDLVPSAAIDFGITGACEIVTNALQDQILENEESSSLQSLYLMHALCSDPSNITKIVVAGAMTSMIKAAQKFSQLSEVVLSLTTMIELITAPTIPQRLHHQQLLGNERACVVLIDALAIHLSNDKIVHSIFKALLAICSGHDENRASISEYRTLELISSVLDTYCDKNLNVALSICSLVVMLAPLPEVSETLGRLGICDLVIRSLRLGVNAQDIDACETMAYAVASLIRGNCGNQMAFGRNELTSSLMISMLTGWARISVSAEESALWVLALLCKHSPSLESISFENIDKLRLSGAYPAVIATVQKHLSNEDCVIAGSYAICNLALTRNVEEIDQLGSTGACETILNVLEAHISRTAIVEVTLDALANLSHSHSNRKLLRQLHVDSTLVKVTTLKEITQQIVLVLFRTISLLCVDFDLRKAFAERQICQFVIDQFLSAPCTYPSLLVGLDCLLGLSSTPDLCLTIISDSLLQEYFIEDFLPSYVGCDNSSEIICRVLDILKVTAEYSSDNCHRQIRLGINKLISRLLEQYSELSIVVGRIADFIRVLCLGCESTVTNMTEFGLLDSILAILQRYEENDQISHQIDQVLQVIMTDKTTRTDIGLKNSCSLVLRSLTSNLSDPTTIEQSCLTIIRLIQKNKDYVPILVNSGICETLGLCIRQHLKAAQLIIAIFNVIELICENMETVLPVMRGNGIIEAVISAFRRHSSAMMITNNMNEMPPHALRVIFQLASDNENCTSLNLLGCCEIITHVFSIAISTRNEKVVAEAARTISKLCENGSINAETFGIAGICVLMSTALSGLFTFESTIESLFFAVSYLCRQDNHISTENIHNVTAFYNLQIDEKVVKIIRDFVVSPKIARSGSLVIQRLARDESSILRLSELGVCEIIPNILSRYLFVNMDVAINAIAALESLAVVEKNVNVLMRDGTVLAISQLLDKCGPLSLNVAMSCCNVVRHIVEIQDHLIEEFIQQGICEGIMKSALAHNDQVPIYFVISICSTIQCVLKNPRGVKGFEAYQSCEILLKYLIKFEDDEECAVVITGCFAGLSANDVFSSYLITNSAHSIILKCLRRHLKSESLVRNITSIITRLLNPNKQGKNLAEYFVNAGLSDTILGISRRYSESSDILLKVCMIFSVIALEENVSVSLGNDGGCEIILNAIRTFHGDHGIVLYGCKAIRTMCNNDENRAIYMSLGVLDHILLILRRFLHTEAVVVTACSALVSLSISKHDPEISTTLKLLEAAGDLVRLLIIQIESPVIVEQLCSLFPLLATDESSRLLLGSNDICRSLTIALQKHIQNEIIVEKVVHAISRVAFKCDENKFNFSKTNISECLVKAYKIHSKNITIIEACCLAITALTHSHEENATSLGRYGVCEMITNILNEKGSNPRLCGVACQTIFCLTKVEINLNELKRLDFGTIIVQCMKQHWTQSVVKHICSALASFSKSSDDADLMQVGGICPLLVKALSHHMDNKDFVPSIVAAVTALSSHSPNCCLELYRSGICDHLLVAFASLRDIPTSYLQLTSAMFSLASTLPEIALKLGSQTLFDLLAMGIRSFINEQLIVEKTSELLIHLVSSDGAKSSAGLSGVCEAIARAFEVYEENEVLVSILSRVIHILCQNHPANSDRCAKSKLCLMILRSLENFISSSDVTKNLLLSIQSLANTMLNRRFFGGGDGCELLKVVLLKNIDHQEVVINACVAISCIAEGSFENKELFGRIGILEVVIKMMNNYKEFELAVVAACDVLYVLSTEHKNNLEKLSQDSLAETLQGILKLHPFSSAICVSVCRLLVAFLHHNPEFVHTLKSLNFRGLIVSSLQYYQEQSTSSLFSIRLLRDIYACDDNENSVLDPLPDECKFISNILKRNLNNMIINEDACSVIFLLSRKRMSSCAATFGMFGACELIAQVASLALDLKNVTLAKMALLAMVSLCAGNQENQEKFGHSNACPTVVSILQKMSGDSSVLVIDMEGAALNAIAMLARHSKVKSSENLDNIKVLSSEGACEIVVGCLERRLDNMPLVYSACRAIFCLAGDDDCSRRFIRCNASDLVTRVLKTYQTFPAISQYACGAVANIGYDDYGASSLFTVGVCEPLVKAITMNKKDVQLVIHGCNAIKNLSVNNLEIRASLGAAGGCKAIISVLKLHSNNTNVLIAALPAIANLSVGIPIHVEYFMQANLHFKLIRIGEDYLSDENICGSVFMVLGNLSEHEFVRDHLRSIGTFDLITKALSHHLLSEHIVVRCCVSLIRLLKIDELNSIDYKNGELCEHLVKALDSYLENDFVMNILYDCLSSMINASSYNKEKLLTLSNSRNYIYLLKKPISDSTIATQICRCVRFFGSDQSARLELRKLDGCLKVSEILAHNLENEEIVRLSMLAIQALATGCPENQSTFIEVGICPQIISALSLYFKSEITARTICMGILTVIERNTPNVRLISQTEFCISLCGYMQLSWSKPQHFEHICQLVTLLCESPDCRTRLGKYNMCEYLCFATREYLSNSHNLKLSLEACIAMSSENKDNVASIGSFEFCQTLMLVFRTHLTSLDIMITTLQLSVLLAQNQTLRIRFGDIGLCENIVLCCRKNQTNEQIITLTLSLLRVLASNVPLNKKLIGECGGCELIVEILKFGYCDSKQIEIACGALANLANESSEGQNVLRLDNAGIVTALVDIFQGHSNSTSIMKQTCLIIRHLTASKYAPQKKLGELEICEKIVMVLAMHLSVQGLNLIICSCVRALAQDPENKILLGSNGACNIVTKLLQYSVEIGDIKLTEESLITIASLVQGSCMNQDIAGKAGACRAVSELIGADNGAQIDEKALWCVTYLCRSGIEPSTSNEPNIRAFSVNGVIESILLDLELHTETPALIISALWALRNMCYLSDNATQVITTRGFETLCNILKKYPNNQSICEAACFAFSSILVVDYDVSLGQTGICELLSQVLQRYNNIPSIVDRCCSCIANLSSQGIEYRHRFGVANVCSNLVRALRLHIELSTVVEEACGVVWNMCLENSENRIKFGIEGTCELIVEILRLHTGDSYVQQAGVGALRSLIVGNSENLHRIEACGVSVDGGSSFIIRNMNRQILSPQE